MSRKVVIGSIVGAFLLPLAPVLAQDWAGRGRVQGTVQDQDGNPIADAQVQLTRPEGDGPEVLLTNEKGRWSFLGLTNGQWTVTVSSDGYVTSEGSMNVSEFGTNPPLVVTLRPIPEEVLLEAAAAKAMAILEEGNELLTQGEFDAARERYETALAQLGDESQPPILLGIARSYYLQGNVADTEATLKRIFEIAPDDVDALKMMASLLIEQDRDEEATVYMDRLPEDELLDVSTYLNVGIEHYNAGELADALTEFESVVARFPANPEGYYYRGLVRLSQGENEGAAADLHKVLELDPDGPHADEVHDFLAFLEPEGD